jgi:hypothetical protein
MRLNITIDEQNSDFIDRMIVKLNDVNFEICEIQQLRFDKQSRSSVMRHATMRYLRDELQYKRKILAESREMQIKKLQAQIEKTQAQIDILRNE